MSASSFSTDDLVSAIPNLRAFALSLSASQDHADDLVQETLLKAWSKMDQFEAGTCLRAWLFTILRNNHYSGYRRKVHEIEDCDGSYANRLIAAPNQYGRLDFEDFRKALGKLSGDQRDALLLVGADGLRYEDAAKVCGCTLGTLKSRLHRARTNLAKHLGLDDTNSIGFEATAMTVLSSTAPIIGAYA